jgi:signal transduction histidine kinase
VPARVRDVVFNVFDHGAGAPEHSPGFGVGLSLVAQFAALHDGRAWLEDRAGGGTTVHVYLPTAPAAA